MMTSAEFDEIEHTADWALLARGSSLPELFVNAATGMYTLAAELDRLHASTERTIEVSGIDAETLLVNWLNELLYYTEMDQVVFGWFEIEQFASDHLRAVARGEAGVPLVKPIKAVTFHDLQIKPSGNGYEVTIVFDV
jgi:SHS2 domain-containing protein